MTFRQFLEQTKVDKPWVAKKEDVLKLWNSTRPDNPISFRPIPPFHKGNRFDQDGIRITGSSQFINSVLGKLKQFLLYSDHPSLDLDVKYRQVQKRNLSDRSSFACYINVVSKKQK
jgi:hypothetical protein